MSDSKPFQQASQDFSADLAALRDDISKLTGSVSQLLRSRASGATDQAYSTYSQTRDTLADRASHLSDRMADHAGDVRDRLSSRAADAQERLGAFSSDVETKIERNPLTAVVVAAIAGLLMGLLSRSF
jgi:ElaB/YqjD/DUF883 family membrane-anchored ribosome-binding protein